MLLKTSGAGPFIALGKAGQTPPPPEVATFTTFAFLAVYVCGHACVCVRAPADLATLLDQEGVAIRAGHHCTQPLHAELGVPGSARASLYIYNTKADVDALCDELSATVAFFKMLEESS